jgi:phospholipid-translocating ATPase
MTWSLGAQDIVQKTRDDINDFSTTGLRTLLICSKEISEQEYAEIDERYHSAETFVGNEKEKEQRMAEVAKLFEHSFNLLGCTAIEDRLQSMVPETIHNLLRVCFSHIHHLQMLVMMMRMTIMMMIMRMVLL